VIFELALSVCGGRRFDALVRPYFRGGVLPETEFGSIERYKVAPIQDPGRDRVLPPGPMSRRKYVDDSSWLIIESRFHFVYRNVVVC
jgi:hypothetical protein